MKYTFQSVSGHFVEVDASSETWARQQAMTQLHGLPTPLKCTEPGTKAHLVIGEPVYFGGGLNIVDEK